MKQHGCEVALWGGGPRVRPVSCQMSLVFQFQLGRKQSLPFAGKGKVYSEGRSGADLHREKAPHLVPDWPIFMQIRAPNLHSLIGPKSTVLIG